MCDDRDEIEPEAPSANATAAAALKFARLLLCAARGLKTVAERSDNFGARQMLLRAVYLAECAAADATRTADELATDLGGTDR